MRIISVQKTQLGIDLSLCCLFLLLTMHRYTFTPIIYMLWALRIWTNFLLYRRSSMAVYSIGMSAIVGLLAFTLSPYITEMLLDVLKVVTSLFGGDGRMLVHEIRMDARNGEYWNTLCNVVGCITYLWLVIVPLVQYIPANFLFVNYLRKYDLADWAKARYNAMPATAKDCIECGSCETKCPYDLPIREMLKKCAADMA